MADIRDEHGNPIQLTDQHGNPVQLTDEHGNPMHLTGVAMSTTTVGSEIHGAPGSETTGVNWTGVGAREHDHQLEQQKQQQHDQGVSRSSSSSSGSSGDDGQGEFIEGQDGRREKKGLKEKIKEKLTGGKNKEEHSQAVSFSSTATTTISAGPAGTQQYHDREKKSVIEKIKDKLPGHHTN